uniref:Uncharacterized protein n=1 Tax=Anguilla anguilla TaxID=7936 RepID=A0A0E9V0L6_ANGAN
MQRCNSQK